MVTATPHRAARTAWALILSAALVGSLAACTNPLSSAECLPVVPEGPSAALVSATGAFGSPPRVDFPTPLRSNGTQTAVIDAGDGAIITAGQFVDFQVSLFNALDGELITQSAYGNGQPPLRRAAGAQTDLLAESLACANVGSRLAVTGTIEDVFGPGALPADLGIADSDPIVLVMDLQAAYLSRASGAPQLGAAGIPAVVTAPSGAPGITIPNEAPPSELRSHTLVRGDGVALEEGDRAVLHYTGVVWESSSIFDSSWTREAPATFTIASFETDPSGIVPGLAQGLIGATVGSQVIVVIPPDLGYPAGQGPASIPPGSTMVFVVDVLGVEG